MQNENQLQQSKAQIVDMKKNGGEIKTDNESGTKILMDLKNNVASKNEKMKEMGKELEVLKKDVKLKDKE